jgi:hypothetical protein
MSTMKNGLKVGVMDNHHYLEYVLRNPLHNINKTGMELRKSSARVKSLIEAIFT